MPRATPPPDPSGDPLQELLRQPVSALTLRFVEQAQPVPHGLLAALEADPRQAARALARRLRTREGRNRAEGQRLRNLLRFEVELWEQGLEHVAGVDEAGMAPLAGPVVAAAAVLPRGYRLRGLDDSKKILDERRREELAEAIKRDALAWGVGVAEVEEIDRLNIYHAGLLAMRRAVEALGLVPHFALVDARKIPECPCPQRGIIHGDALSLSIAAASVLAKTTRDRMMVELDRQHPGYGLAVHKGYPTPKHLQALRERGVLPIHRRSFAPVREALGLPRAQGELFPAPAAAAVPVPSPPPSPDPAP
ncbi:ribonuclease HII [Aggregicoccus sp. 17bor-14]|uniref:ribonuclease HII n=1 Tax=Myxococcaceae TaxID=31 RepID=UPI00129CE610|nr:MULTISPECIES: ribonuclease HII [Myxococcaceae]MBF5041502.1 ribonuclease HII [Simulacricoccus sp. 17bor-14]MRI87286.1 ribonuclease HII [Aggregicoccus sp. 17bor-14]